MINFKDDILIRCKDNSIYEFLMLQFQPQLLIFSKQPL